MQTMESAGPVEFSLFDYLEIARKRWPWLLVPILICVALSTAWTLTRPPVYSSSARVLLNDTASRETLDPGSQNTGILTRELSNEILLAFSDEVKELVEQELGETPEVEVTSDADADVLEFRATASSADRAAEFANVWAEQYIAVKRAGAVTDIQQAVDNLQLRLEELRADRRTLRKPLDDLSDAIAVVDEEEAETLQREYDRVADDLRYELQLVTSEAEQTVASLSQLNLQAELASFGEARVVQVASPPLTTTNAPLSRNIALGAVLGLLSGFGLALLIETRDTTIKSPADLQRVTDLPMLAAVPEADKNDQVGLEFSTITSAEGGYANAYHKVRSSLEFLSVENKELRSILVTSAGASEGKTTSSTNLALAFASVGKRTVLADVDFRRGRLHDVFGIGQSPGLSDVIVHGLPLNNVACRLQNPDLATLLVLPTGTTPPNSAAFVGTDGFLRTMAWLRDQSEYVILDAPPILAVSDPHTMAKNTDGVVLTVMAGTTKTGELAGSIEALQIAGATILGLILVGVDDSDNYGRYYGSSTTTRALPKGDMSQGRPLQTGLRPDQAIDLRDHASSTPVNARS